VRQIGRRAQRIVGNQFAKFSTASMYSSSLVLIRSARVSIPMKASWRRGQQRLGGFAKSLLRDLGISVSNQFGLRPAKMPDGSAAPIKINTQADRFNLLQGVRTFHLHPHLPHLEMLGDSPNKLDVLVEQSIDLAAPPHPFVKEGRKTFDALLQSKPNVFGGRLLICDATLWTSTNGRTG
jgi:hypothetical protein